MVAPHSRSVNRKEGIADRVTPQRRSSSHKLENSIDRLGAQGERERARAYVRLFLRFQCLVAQRKWPTRSPPRGACACALPPSAVHPPRRVPYNQSKCANAAAVAAAGAALLFLPSAVAADAAAALPFRSVPLRSFAQDLSDSFSRNCDA